ncbi:hypothetical protein GCM10011410_31130 [Hoyosella rhizosphaerae]|uniref:Uncharacterized protein n=1 Tax=Hoyosella rhizosphaerae TaxID=1755582 RepID=A0A916XJT2_9ACTN|nr:hypothetical protein GCM10011410_31130 [Hoyosella rhizosphaerae]
MSPAAGRRFGSDPAAATKEKTAMHASTVHRSAVVSHQERILGGYQVPFGGVRTIAEISSYAM